MKGAPIQCLYFVVFMYIAAVCVLRVTLSEVFRANDTFTRLFKPCNTPGLLDVQLCLFSLPRLKHSA